MVAENIPVSSKEGIEVKVIAGEAFGVKVLFFFFFMKIMIKANMVLNTL